MKRLLLALGLVFACLLSGCQAQDTSQPTTLPPVQVFFSPKGGCTEAVVKELNAAKTSVLVQAYSFTSTPIAKALLEAHKRGVKVEVVLDKSQRTEKYSEADFLVNVGIPTKIDAQHAIAHNKVMVIDGATVITGSFNFTKAAENNNAENLLVIRSPELTAQYAVNWKVHADHSEPYCGRTEGYSQTHREAKPAEPPSAAEASDGYVASKNSGVFHKAACESAAKISTKNLIHYATRRSGRARSPATSAIRNPRQHIAVAMPNPPLTIRLRHSPAFAAQSHGWCYLAPFSIDGDRLDWAVRLPKGGARRVSLRWSDRSDTVRVVVPGRKIGEADREFLRSRVRRMFRADEDFGEFWELCRSHAVLRHCRSKRTGALLRCATVFEDTVKTVCTTNCSWWNTKSMVANLCRMFGEPCPGDGESFTFPTPERLAAASADELKGAKVGFRARYILEFARRVADGDLDLDEWCREKDPHALRTALLGIKGVGSYGANHLLMLLGHYGKIPCDSEVREYLGVSPKAGQKAVERAAAKRYGHWGRYCYLAYKFERVFKRLNYVDIVDGKKR